MSRVGVQLRRELSAYFMTPMGFVIMTILLIFTGFFFSSFLVQYRLASFQLVVAPLVIVNFLIAPVISMRLVAEERRTGTFESLMTAPVREWEIVIAKYLGALLFYVILYVPTLIYLGVLFYYSESPRIENGPEIPQTITAYLALILTGAAYLSIGLFVSTLTRHQIVAAILAFLVCLMLYFMGFAGSMMQASGSETIRYLGAIVDYLAVTNHTDAFSRGILSTTDAVYFLSMVAFFVFLSHISLVLKK